MMKPLSISLILLALVAGNLTPQTDRHANLRSLVEAERAFAKMSIEKGTKASFVENLAEDSILFRPGPVAGKKWMQEHPAPPGILTWRPIFADVSRAGDLGYTTGPWEFREKSLEDKPVAHGQFVTIWKRQADGVWKAVVDLGTRNAPPRDAPASDVQSPADNEADKNLRLETDVEVERSALVKLEDESSRLVATKKTVDALLSSLAGDVRLFRMNAFPALGREAARAMLAAKPGLYAWQPVKADVSRSGDLGYTYGPYKSLAGDVKGAEQGHYVRIWKRQTDDNWKVVLDILNPLPPAAN
jgi:ketosteroid isomerase-like protein